MEGGAPETSHPRAQLDHLGEFPWRCLLVTMGTASMDSKEKEDVLGADKDEFWG